MLIARTTMEAREAHRTTSGRAAPPVGIGRPDDVRAPGIREAVLRAEGEYREMPGLCLTLPQAARLWGLDPSTCERVLAHLVERRILKLGLNGTYLRR